MVDTLLDTGQFFFELILIFFQFGLLFLATQKTPGQTGAAATAPGLPALGPLDIRFTTHDSSPPFGFYFVSPLGIAVTHLFNE
jgi:hypothetical protein